MAAIVKDLTERRMRSEMQRRKLYERMVASERSCAQRSRVVKALRESISQYRTRIAQLVVCTT
jgi:hypothetical protein